MEMIRNNRIVNNGLNPLFVIGKSARQVLNINKFQNIKNTFVCVKMVKS